MFKSLLSSTAAFLNWTTRYHSLTTGLYALTACAATNHAQLGALAGPRQAATLLALVTTQATMLLAEQDAAADAARTG